MQCLQICVYDFLVIKDLIIKHLHMWTIGHCQLFITDMISLIGLIGAPNMRTCSHVTERPRPFIFIMSTQSLFSILLFIVSHAVYVCNITCFSILSFNWDFGFGLRHAYISFEHKKLSLVL